MSTDRTRVFEWIPKTIEAHATPDTMKPQPMHIGVPPMKGRPRPW